MQKEVMNNAEADEAKAEGRITFHEVDPVGARTFRVMADSNEVLLVFQRTRPGLLQQKDGSVHDVAEAQTVAVIAMSPQSAKDLMLVLSEQIAGYEKRYGEVRTDYTRQIAEAKK